MSKNSHAYVLITPAKDEEAFIEATLESVISQTILPAKWIIVSDGSIDNTDAIIGRYARRYPFIYFCRRDKLGPRDFASKVHAFRVGLERLNNLDFDFIGNQDADCSFASDYYEDVLSMFAHSRRLGIAGGQYYENIGKAWVPQRVNCEWSVTGGVQMFRRKCYEDIGGYMPLSGGVDSAAEVMARQDGWEVRTNPNLIVYHHRRTGCGHGNILEARFKEGLQEWSLGYHPAFEVLKQFSRILERPYFVGSISHLMGYLSMWIRNSEKSLPENVVKYLRAEQKSRIFGFLKRKQI
jgi:biofilm PGA synthesis N-glycosyltransferase PgaC